MKNQIKNITTKAFIKAQVTTKLAKEKLLSKLKENNGSVSIEMALIIVIILVVLGVALAFIVPYFKDNVGTKITDKTDEFFNFVG